MRCSPLYLSCLDLEDAPTSFNCLWLSSTTVFSRSTFSVYTKIATIFQPNKREHQKFYSQDYFQFIKLLLQLLLVTLILKRVKQNLMNRKNDTKSLIEEKSKELFLFGEHKAKPKQETNKAKTMQKKVSILIVKLDCK